MISAIDIVRAAPSELKGIKSQLTVQKMKLDKFFSVFLDNNELREDDLNTPEWKTYKSMLEDYEKVSLLLKTTNYYLTK